jgi:hypothetical protein
MCPSCQKVELKVVYFAFTFRASSGSQISPTAHSDPGAGQGAPLSPGCFSSLRSTCTALQARATKGQQTNHFITRDRRRQTATVRVDHRLSVQYRDRQIQQKTVGDLRGQTDSTTDRRRLAGTDRFCY